MLDENLKAPKYIQGTVDSLCVVDSLMSISMLTVAKSSLLGNPSNSFETNKNILDFAKTHLRIYHGINMQDKVPT